MTPEELINIATRHQVFLERLKSSEANETAKAIAFVEGEVVSALKDLEVEKLSELNRKQLKSLLASIQQTSGKLLDDSIDGLLSRLSEISEYEIGFEARALESIGKQLTINLPNSGTVSSAALAKPIPASGDFVVATLRKWKASTISDFASRVKQGYADGLSVAQVVKNIRGSKANRFLDGIGAKSRRDASTVTRTAIQHYSQVAREEVWKANDDLVEGWRFVATLDSRTSSTCRSLDGQTFTLGEGPTPPRHYNCRSVSVPELGPDFDFLDEEATRSAQGGPVDANLSYYDWLKKQPAAFQDAAIGPDRARLFRDGGLSADRFARLNLNRNFEPLTLAEMRKLEPLAFERAGLPTN